MPKNNNERRPLESIQDGRKRIRLRSRYGTYGGELNEATITADRPEQKPTGNGIERIRKFIHPYGTEEELKNTYLNEEHDLSNKVSDDEYLILPSNALNTFNQINSFSTYQNRLADFNRRTDEYRGNYASSLLPGKTNANQNDVLSQLGRWYSRKYGYNANATQNDVSFSNRGTDIIDLDKNVIRLTPKSKQSTALFNEFVEKKYPSVHPAIKYQRGEIRTFGDKYEIPIDNISLFAGVEDGHFKVDSLKNFNPETTIYPVRNIRRGTLPITKLVIKNVESNNSYDPDKQGYYQELYRHIDPFGYARGRNQKYNYGDSIQKERYDSARTAADKIDSLLALGKTAEVTRLIEPNRPSGAPPLSYTDLKLLNDGYRSGPKTFTNTPDFYEPERIKEIRDSLSNVDAILRPIITESADNKKYFYIDTANQENPISNYNASILDSKMVFGNPNGGKFVGRIQDISSDQLDSINTGLSHNPSGLVRPDLGSFDQYRLDHPTLAKYLEQYYEHPKPKDPNVFTIGTTEPNKVFE